MPNIKTFCRIKPTSDVYPEHELSKDTLQLSTPEVLRDYNTPSKGGRAFVHHEFHFDHIFDQNTTQEQVFEVAARNIVQGVLNGYNGTIFAYGQTGTGKTYTVEGSAKTYNQRGLEPRSLSMIYQELEKRTQEDIAIHISYLEIYQEVGYDLLNPGARTNSFVTPFPKVTVLEGHGGLCIIRNLSNHLAASEEVAQSLLLQGQANRKVAATAVHDRSSRSHAVFTIQLTAKKPDSDTVVKSKLHLVDLAGSERVAKTGVFGAQLTEAKSINLSLHHLESVIVALQTESQANAKRVRTSEGRRKFALPASRPNTADGPRRPQHVPYRNSLLTMVLRDSLGGNCMTTMIATISLEIVNIGESISTCRFAGRVACIANSVSRNEELDEKSLIKKLRKKINELEAELACLRLEQAGDFSGGGDMSLQVTDEDRTVCTRVIQQYLAGRIADPVSAGVTNPFRFRECLKILKTMILRSKFGSSPADTNNNMHSMTSLSVSIPGHYPDNSSPSLLDPDETGPDQQNPEMTSQVSVNPDDSGQYQELNGGKAQVLRFNEGAAEDDGGRRRSKSPGPAPSRPVKQDGPPIRRNVKAWGEESAARQDRTDMPNFDNDSMNKSKDPETVSQILNMASKDKVKTPFEQQREKEIKKLSNKVEKLETDRLAKEQQVFSIKLKVAEQELNLMERHMRTKLGVTTAQVQDQHAYVEQLKATEADHALLEQEKLVLQQLKKRQARFQKQLEYIEQRKEELNQHNSATGGATPDKKATVQDMFGQFRKRDGSLNTRQVFQMLKSEERKQTKAKNEVDKERVIATSSLMEVRELATRQRLRELKDMMKSGEHFGPFDQTDPGFANVNGHAEPGTGVINGHSEPKVHFDTSQMNGHAELAPKEEKKLNTQKDHSNSGRSVRHGQNDSKAQVSKHPGGSHGNSRNNTFVVEAEKPSNSKADQLDRSASSMSNRSSAVRTPDPDFYAKRKKEKDPTSKWESTYSRPTTPVNPYQESETHGHVYVPNVKNGMLVNNHSEEKVSKDQQKTDSKPKQKHESKQLQTQRQKSKESEQEEIKMDVKPRPSSPQAVSPRRSVNREDSRKSMDSRPGEKTAVVMETKGQGLTSDVIETESRRLEEELLNNRNRLHQHRQRQGRQPIEATNTFMPSEYVHNMADGDGFDARKMGLASKNFDSALTSMLNKEDSQMVIKHEDYDEYARTGPYNVSPYLQTVPHPKVSPYLEKPRAPPHHKQRSRSSQRPKAPRSAEEKPPKADAKSAWSPDIKGSPISAKIARYLQQSPSQDRKRRPGKSSSAGAERQGYDITDISKYRQSASSPSLDSKAPSGLEIEEERPGRVTALKEQEREVTYMNRALSQKDRVKKIRIAQQSATRIQRAWRRFQLRKARTHRR